MTTQVTNSTTATNTSTSTSSSATSAASTATVNYNQFLQLLVAELQNQDPTAPTDPMQYMSQLASFSVVGQSVQTNSKLSTLMTSNALSQADLAVGRTATSADGTTTGTISSVVIGSDGTATATLSTGATLALGAGVKVS